MQKIQGDFIFVSGSPGASNIGNFLLQHKDYFTKHYIFKIKRIMAHEVPRYANIYKALPALRMHGNIYYGNDIFKALSVGLNPKNTITEESHEDYMIRMNKFTKNGDNISFDDKDDDDDEDYNTKIARKMKEFSSKSANRAIRPGGAAIPQPKMNPQQAPINYAIEENDDDEDFQAQWKKKITGGF